MIEFLNLYDELFRNLASGIAVIIASIVAIVGLTTWRKQLKGKAEYELARRLAKGVYELRNSIISIRLPHRRGEWNVYEKLWTRVSGALVIINLELLEAEALWGQEIVDKVNEVKKYEVKLRLAVERSLKDDFSDRKNREEIYGTIWENYPKKEKDEFQESFFRAIAEVDFFLKPYLRIKT